MARKNLKKLQALNPQPIEKITGDKAITLDKPRAFKNMAAVKREMARVYRAIYEHKVTIQQAGMLILMLDKIGKAIQAQIAVDQMTSQYQEQWSGFQIVGPTDADALKQVIIPPEKSDNESEEDDDNDNDED